MLGLIQLVAGLALLIKGADLLVQGSSAIAGRLGVSPLIVGLTIVSFGTSLPELLVTLVAGLRDKPDLAIASVIGSNIANVLLILGVAAMVRPLPVRDSTVVSEIPFSLTAALLVGFLANAALFSGVKALTISRLDGAILLFFFALFMLYILRMSRQDRLLRQQDGLPEMSTARSAAYVAVGVVGLYFGGDWTVKGAVDIAALLGIDDAVIGLTVIAFGTSSPELITSAVAAYRHQPELAVGNVVGSNIFNLLWILGLSASVVELPFTVVSNTDLMVVIGSGALIFVALLTSPDNRILRYHGVIFVSLYVAYLYYVVQRSVPV